MGSVVQQAARELKETLTTFVAGQFGVAAGPVGVSDDSFIVDGVPVMSWAEAAKSYIDQRGELRVFKLYESPPSIQWDDATYRGDAYPAFAFAADVAEVEVDLETFEISILKITNASDVGRAIHPILAQGQIEGGTVQAVGYATIEEVVVQDGRMVNDRLTNYLIPTSVDAPDIETFLIEAPYPNGPFGAKGIGELPMDGAAPAIASAVRQATGIMVTELPVTPERLQQAVESGLVAH
jgi:CO/xanthine dehydrogenase Mo-binding subunit